MNFGDQDPLTLPRSYNAVHAPDGTVRVPGVPIFGENVRVSPQGDLSIFGPRWLRGAIQKDTLRRSEGYYAPLHFGHHEPGIVREPAGHIELESVGLRWYCGEPTWVLFGSMVFKDTRRFQKAREQYPYRSVEISHEMPDEVNSLALLDTEAPYFRFPNLTFSAASTTGGTTHLHWRHKLLMATFGTEIVKGLPAPKKEPIGGSMHEGGGPAPAPAKDAEGANPMPDIKAGAEPMEEPGLQADAGGAPAGDPGAGDLAARIARLEAMVAKLCGAGVEAAAPPMADPMAGPAKKVPIVSASAASASARFEGMFAAQAGRLAQLEAEIKNRDTRDAQATAVKEELKSYGIPNLELEVKTRAKDGSLSVWASTIKQFGNKVAPAAGETPAETTDAPEVAKYSAHGPEKLAEARRCAQLFNATSKKSLVRNHGLAAFLASNVKVEE